MKLHSTVRGRMWSIPGGTTNALLQLALLISAGAHDPGRDRRIVFTTSSHTSTTTMPVSNRQTTEATTEATSSTSLSGVAFFQFYRQFPRSAIALHGQSYFINFEKPLGTLVYVAELCYFDPTCVSFDYESGFPHGTGYMHRVTRHCAASVGGTFVDGNSDDSVYFELLPEVLQRKGINASECWQSAGQSDSSYDRTALAGQVFGTTAAVLFATLVAMIVIFIVMASVRRRRMIADIIDVDAQIDDGHDGAEVRIVNDAGDAAEDNLLAPA